MEKNYLILQLKILSSLQCQNKGKATHKPLRAYQLHTTHEMTFQEIQKRKHDAIIIIPLSLSFGINWISWTSG